MHDFRRLAQPDDSLMPKLIHEIRSLFLSHGTFEKMQISDRKLILALAMLISDPEELVRQEASWHLGELVAKFETGKQDEYIRRLLWRLNPESGDNPVGVPELVGEIGVRISERVAPFLPAFVQCAGDEKLLPGLLQALGRIGQTAPHAVADYSGMISDALSHAHPVVFGNAALALWRINSSRAGNLLRDDQRVIRAFCRDAYQSLKVRELAVCDCASLGQLCFISERQ